ncbi:hypothetical protein LCGC14_2101570 [marine sediment metagenome]|uniref:Uncharacterized protein n=1 Tax=marine sediment metagenome TaxID=412755 RepID=A0A0F9EX10_9ZZZZ
MHRLTIKKEDKEHYSVFNENEEFLGEIYYDTKWGQFVFTDPEKTIKLASDCLDQISEYCKKL